MKRIISLLLVAVFLIQGPLMVFGATSSDITINKQIFKLGAVDEFVLTASSEAFTDGLTTVSVTKEGVSTPLSIKSQTPTELVVIVPNTLSTGTYALVVGDPSGDNLGTGLGYNLGNIQVGNPTASISVVPNLPLGYSEPVDVTINGSLVNFELGQSTVEVTNGTSVLSATVKSITANGDFAKNMVVTLPTGLTSGTYKAVITTNEEVVEAENAVVVRGVPSINTSVTGLNEGYSQTSVSITGLNTGFNEQTTVTILDGQTVRNVVSNINVTSSTNLTFSLAAGLSPGGQGNKTYEILVETGVESSQVDLVVQPASITLKNSGGTAEVGQVSRSGDVLSFRVEGVNTGFLTGETTVQLLNSSDENQEKISNVTIQDATHLSFDLNQNIEVGTYTILVTTGNHSEEATLMVVAPSLASVTYDSIFDIENEETVGLGYPLISVTVEGNNTSFSNATTVTLSDGSILENKILNLVANGSTLTFDIATGLPVGTYNMTIDVDGQAGTTFDRFVNGTQTLEFLVVSPALSSVSPSTVVNLSDKTVTVQGTNTHFDANATYSVQLLAPDSSVVMTTSDVTVVDASSLSFAVAQGAVSAGLYDVKVQMTRGSYTEILTLTDALNVVSMGVKDHTPVYIYEDQMAGGVEMVVYGEGVSFNSSTLARLNGLAVTGITLADRDSDSNMDLVFKLPSDLTEGVQTLVVTHGVALENYTFVVYGNRSLTLTSPDLLTFYTGERLTLTGTNINYKLNNLGENTPTAVLVSSDASEQNLTVSLSDTENNVAILTLPDSLAEGTYTVNISFDHANSLFEDINFSDSFTVNKRYTALKFYDDASEIANLAKDINSADLTLVPKGIVSGSNIIEDLNDRASLIVLSGDDYITLTGRTVSFDAPGEAVIQMTCDGLTETLEITVADVGTVNPTPTPTPTPMPTLPPVLTENNEVEFSADEPVLEFEETGIVMDFTGATVEEGVTITAKEVDESAIPEAENNANKLVVSIVGKVYEFTASETFKGKVEIKIPYDSTKVNNSNSLVASYFDETKEKWVVLGGKVDPINHTVTFYTNHFSYYTVLERVRSFDDLNGYLWSENAVNTLASRGVINGYGGTDEFRPGNHVSRAEFATMVVQALNLFLEDTEQTFTDIEGKWYEDIIKVAASNGILSGYNNKAMPESKITREQMATMIMNAYKLSKGQPLSIYANTFSDKADVSSWAQLSVANAHKLGIISGKGNNTFAPADHATRAEAAVMIYNLIKTLDYIQ